MQISWLTRQVPVSCIYIYHNCTRKFPNISWHSFGRTDLSFSLFPCFSLFLWLLWFQVAFWGPYDVIRRDLPKSRTFECLCFTYETTTSGLFNGLYFRSIITTTGRSIRLILTPISLNALIANKNMNGSGQLIFPRLNNIHPSIHLPVLPFYPSLYNERC